ncbi:DUF1479-domain-containing protein [Auriscalpium vulgare]|uniref:DUF1479-domain-containing protein n=1 Tax=Auriscalpium vulgare TaxID=40419 RepID=A0ACB8S5M4_9AGAM|nr:DUF1479-domain-containing protein [Auriscalpium vulgare]
MPSLPTTTLRAHLSTRISTRSLAAVATSRKPKEEGSIASVFTSLTGEAPVALPPRFADLKKQLWKDALAESWREVTRELKDATEEVAARGTDLIPVIPFEDVKSGLSAQQQADIKKRGVVVVKGGVAKEEALGWKDSIRSYIAANKEKVKGFPDNNIQAYEIYNSAAQTRARTHPALITTQRALLQLWHTSDAGSPVSLRTPVAYFDRLRIRTPGDRSFVLGPHIDGGSVERWEDPGFRACFGRILEGRWREHDPFDASPRIDAKQDLYHAPNQCSVFRPWQGWTSLSTTGPSEGTLLVSPLLHLATAYLILRPFFRPSGPGLDNWVVDPESAEFPGSMLGKAQELSAATHPHLRLETTMVPAPRVEPGDQIYWHCDTIHAVEGLHAGKSDSSVLYIPAVPLTEHNASYLRDQRHNFVNGLPAPDFPGGEGESHFVHRGTVDALKDTDGRRLLGFEAFPIPSNATSVGEQRVIQVANDILA